MSKAFKEALQNMEGSNSLEESKNEREALLKAAEANGRTEVRLEQLHELIEQLQEMNKKLDSVLAVQEQNKAMVDQLKAKVQSHPWLRQIFGGMF